MIQSPPSVSALFAQRRKKNIFKLVEYRDRKKQTTVNRKPSTKAKLSVLRSSRFLHWRSFWSWPVTCEIDRKDWEQCTRRFAWKGQAVKSFRYTFQIKWAATLKSREVRVVRTPCRNRQYWRWMRVYRTCRNMVTKTRVEVSRRKGVIVLWIPVWQV